jgi:hypothetical protein
MTPRIVGCVHVDGLVQGECYAVIDKREIAGSNGFFRDGCLGQAREKLLNIPLPHRSTSGIPGPVTVPKRHICDR